MKSSKKIIKQLTTLKATKEKREKVTFNITKGNKEKLLRKYGSVERFEDAVEDLHKEVEKMKGVD